MLRTFANNHIIIRSILHIPLSFVFENAHFEYDLTTKYFYFVGVAFDWSAENILFALYAR